MCSAWSCITSPATNRARISSPATNRST
ncbi:hypothetical protein AZ019_000267, partial [Klebsiella pneumoniae]